MKDSHIKEIEGIAKQDIDMINKARAKKHYHRIIDAILQPLLECEEIFLNEALHEYYTPSDFHEVLKDAFIKCKEVRLKRYQPITIDTYIKEIKLKKIKTIDLSIDID